MDRSAIFYPMAALALFTVGVVTAAAVARGQAIRRGAVTEDFYRLFQGGNRPDFEARLSRHYGNLLELPVLYYVAGLAIYAADFVDLTFLLLFWSYVAVRLVHAAIHLSYNRVIHRATAFGVGCVIVIIIWVRLLYLVARGAGAA
jgi:hypothetical protein